MLVGGVFCLYKQIQMYPEKVWNTN